MDIKRLNDKTVEIKLSGEKTSINYDPTKNIFTIDVANEVFSTLDKPGEYEFHGFSFFTREQTEDKHDGNINYFALNTDENINIFFFSSDFKFEKEVLEDFDSINILICNSYNKALIESLSKRFTPEVIILLANDNDEEKTKVAQISNIIYEKTTVKFKEEEFSSDDDSVTRYISLSV
ncbi:MAG: hypothetical protein Q9M91_07920 [Candidatus Dojkabacteria bacterium]|nr:hypothetical protein [Candidatus Dojkabacteria bacterium]MDQ7021711.1 hypothetical protein [Candidatus Dojkabacteria bacterium]